MFMAPSNIREHFPSMRCDLQEFRDKMNRIVPTLKTTNKCVKKDYLTLCVYYIY